jgi:hypothetical protein
MDVALSTAQEPTENPSAENKPPGPLSVAAPPSSPAKLGISESDRHAMENACSTKRSLYGPAAYNDCMAEQLKALEPYYRYAQ